MYKNNVFFGENSINVFLNPKNHPFTPLVELPKELNPFYGEGVRIYAKLMNMTPLQNIKSLPSYNMLKKAKEKNELKGINNLIENSSGNTVFSLAVIARSMGIKNTSAFVSYEVPKGKLDMIKLFGVKPIINKEPICPDPADKTSGIYKSKKLAKKIGWFNAGQYENESNPNSHYEITAPQIYEQLEGNLQLFCCGLGTTGTMVGSSKYFKDKDKKIKTVGVIRTPNNPIPGVRTRGLLNMIAFDWKNYTDEYVEIGTKESFSKSLDLIRNGLIVGPSSGFAFSGLLKYLNKMKKEKKITSLKNKNGTINCVFICCDNPFIYLDEYFKYLDSKDFPKIKNENLLLYNKCFENTQYFDKFEISPKKAYNEIYFESQYVILDKIINGDIIKTKSIVIDIRTKTEFNHFSIPNSINVSINRVKNFIKKKFNKKDKIFIVCRLGLKSNYVVNELRKDGYNTFNIKGGITEWSNIDLPRKKPLSCFKK